MMEGGQGNSSNHVERYEILNTMQHFNTSAEDFTDYIFNITIEDFLSSIPTLQKSLQKFFNQPEELEEGTQIFVKRFYEKLEKNSEILEKYLQQVVFKIPCPTNSNTSSNEPLCSYSAQQEKLSMLHQEFEKYAKEKIQVAKSLKECKNQKLKLLKLQEAVNNFVNSFNKDDIESLICAKSSMSDALAVLNK